MGSKIHDMFQRAPRPEAKVADGPEIQKQNILNLLRSVEHDKKVNHHESIYPYISLYRQEGIDIEKYYREHAVTAYGDIMKDNFVHNQRNGFVSQLVESMPLLANKEGRLGEYIQAKVTKTAKQDDQGNDFIDLIVEIDNTWIGTNNPDAPRDIPTKMTFLVDVMAMLKKDDRDERFDKKFFALREKFLVHGEKATVKCYKDEHGILGLERPKLLVTKEADYIQKVGVTLGDCVTQSAGDAFSINKPETFDREYRKYFLDFVDSLGKSAEQNIQYIESLSHDNPKRAQLVVEYKKIVAFVDAYKKTPVTRKRSA